MCYKLNALALKALSLWTVVLLAACMTIVSCGDGEEDIPTDMDKPATENPTTPPEPGDTI